MANYVANMYGVLQRRGFAPRFQHAGIYKITIDGIIVYIGKSTDMLWRLAEHYVAFRHPEGHKYQILSEAKQKGHAVQFDVICYCSASPHSNIVEELGETEGRCIRLFQPPLNTQIPKESDWRKYEYNSTAQTITLNEILQGGKETDD